MNRKQAFLRAVCLILATILTLDADNRIILYLKHPPSNILETVKQEAKNISLASQLASLETQTPGQVSQSIVNSALDRNLKPSLGGFAAIYAGYIDISNKDGLFSFPLRHTTQKVYLIITPQINLINIKENTYSHRELADNAPAVMYSCELKIDDKQQSYWEVREEALPQEKKINPLTIVIFSHPNNFFVPQGHFFALPNVQLVLPDIYVIGRTDVEAALSASLDLRRFFEPITTDQKRPSDTSMQHMITNL